MAANRTQLQNALHKPYDRLLFSREVLNPVFGSGFSLFSSPTSAAVSPNKSESTVIDQVRIYGRIRLDDSTEIICYEVSLQPKVRIEQSKVAIQQYIRKLLTAGQAALINFVSSSTQNIWRLTLVAKDSVVTESGVKEKTTNAKRYTFLLGPSETCRTAAERFEALSTEKEITFQSLVNAFSVEKLSKAFFDEYTLHYRNFCDYLQESNYRKSVFNIDFPNNATKEQKDKASKPIRDFVKKLLGRIVFLYFVQKKGWLGASDTDYTDGAGDFIRQLFFESGGNETFYSNWLTVLFFDTLNTKRVNDDFTMPDGKKVKVPFLNGGLFEKEEFDENLLTFPPKLFHNPDCEEVMLTEKNGSNARGFLDFLDAFNFTVYEDSPDDHTVAVDPEMLGHIFENLLEDNKDKGAFYTPKEIVQYMCQESLIEYLKNSPPLEGWQTHSDGVANSPDDTQTHSDGVANSPDDTQTQSDRVASTATKASIPFRNAKNYFSLPYNLNLKKRAGLLRKAGNLSEVLFWNRVKNKQFKGFDFDRQKIVGNYIVDFFCTNCNVVIEIDGSSHNNKQEYDQARDEYLQSLQLTVIHISVEDVLKNLDNVMQMLFDHPALKGSTSQNSPPQEGNQPPLTPPQEGNGKEAEKVRRLVKEKAAMEFSIEELEYIDQLLDNVKICDPAIGSGAFPMGLLHEILSLKELIAYETGKAWNPAEAKLNIIQNSIYGVDIEKGAVDIARLRFWLSLVIDEEKPKPLPNLDYKIVVGDSLISRFDGEIIEIDWEVKEGTQTDMFGNDNLQNRKQLLQQLTDKQRKYFDPEDKNKKALALEIRNHKIDILINQLELMVKTEGLEHAPAKANFMNNKKFVAACELYQKTQGWIKTIDKLKYLQQHPDEPFHHFDWKLDFPEVLNPYLVPDENRRGFDIVIGNPPYVTFKGKEKVNISDIDVKYLIDVYKNSAEYKINSYALFIEKGLTICKNNGLLSYIIPSTILQNEYLKKIRKLLVTKNHIKQIVTFGNKVFNAVTDSIVLFVSKSIKEDAECISIRKSDLDFNYLNEVKKFKQQIWNDSNKDFVINLKTKYEEDRIIKTIENNSFYIEDFLEVYVGIVANGIKKFLSTSMINSNYKKYLQGKHIDNFQIKPEKLFINFVKDELHSNTDENVYLQKEKILVRKTGNRLIAVIDNKQYFTDQSIYNLYPKKGISVNLKLITGLLNSNLLEYYFNKKMITNPDVFPYIKGIHLKKLPLKFPKNQLDEKKFETIVNIISFLKSKEIENPSEKYFSTFFQKILNGMVYELYFPELLEKYDCEIIKYLGELPEFTESMSDEEKMEICKTVYDLLNDAAHPVRINLEKMKKEVPEIRIIEGLEN